MSTIGGFSIEGPQLPAAAPGIQFVDNGLSKDIAGVATLGNDVGDATEPGKLLNDRVIPMAGFNLFLLNQFGFVVINDNVIQQNGDFLVKGITVFYGDVNPTTHYQIFDPENGIIQVIGDNATVGTNAVGVLIRNTGVAENGLLYVQQVGGVFFYSMDVGALGRMGMFIISGNTFVSPGTLPADNGSQFQVAGTATISARLGIGNVTSMTAALHLPAGTTLLAPLKINPGTLTTVATVGSIENDGDQLWFTINTGTARRILPSFSATTFTADRAAFYNATGLTDSTNFRFSASSTCMTLGGATPASTAYLIFAAGGTSRAAYRYTAGAVQTAVVNGSKEFDGTNEFVSAGSVRYTLAKTLTAVGTLDFPSIGAFSTADLTIPLTGAALGDVVMVGSPAASTPAGIMYTAFVSVAGTVTIRGANVTAIAIDPASGDFRISLIKYT